MPHSRRIRYTNDLGCSGVEGSSCPIVGGLGVLMT
jgi:hypothetical protein